MPTNNNSSQRRRRLESATGTGMNTRKPQRAYADDPYYGGGGRPYSSDRQSTGSKRQNHAGRDAAIGGFAGTSDVKKYLPSEAGQKASNAVGAITAEFLGGLALLFLTVFTDTTSSYTDKMLAIMKRGTLLGISFFLIALISGFGPNAAKVAKAFGLLLDVGLILSVSSDTMLKELDAFFTGAWKPNDSPDDAGSAGAQAGSGTIGQSSGSTGSDIANADIGGVTISGISAGAKQAINAAIGAINPLSNPGELAKGIDDLKKLFGG